MKMNKKPTLAFKSTRGKNDHRLSPYFLISRIGKTCSVEAKQLLAKGEDEIAEIFGWALLELAQKKQHCFVIRNLLTDMPDMIGYREPTNARTVFDLLTGQLKLTANRVLLPIDCEMSIREKANYDLVCTLPWAQRDTGNSQFDPAEVSLSMERVG